MASQKSIYAYISAAALAAVTLFTFYVFRNFGPQSLLRRFHIDIATQDVNDLNQITTNGIQSQGAQFMLQVLGSFNAAHANFQLQGVKRVHSEVLATVEYRFPNFPPRVIVWHVRQEQNDWKVDCDATAEGYAHLFGTT